jgi:hypothetical protein
VAGDVAERQSERLQAVASAWATGICGFVVGICSWSYYATVPIAGVDSSWAVGLQMATRQGLDFGRDIVFTYGPLGWLQEPTAAISPFPELGGLYILAIRIALGIALVWTLRRSLPLWVAAPAALGLALIIFEEPVIALALLSCLVALGPEPPPAMGRWFAPVAGVLAATEMLGKLSIGPPVLAIFAVTALAIGSGDRRDRLRRLGTFLACLVGTFAVLWTATGNSPSNLGPYLRGAYEEINGYTVAMPLIAGSDETLHIVAAIGLLLAGAGVAALGTRGLGRAQRIAAPLIVAIAGFVVWKMAFVRYGPVTYPYLFTVILPPWVAYPWGGLPLRIRGRRVDARPLAFLATLAICVLFFPLTEQPLKLIDPVRRVELGTTAMKQLILPGRVDSLSGEARTRMTTEYELDPKSLALLQGHSVDVDPSAIGIAWAYGLDWRPLPVFQDYSAYTPYLDGVNRDSLLAADGPERILRTFTVQLPPTLAAVNLSEAQTYNSYSSTDGRFSPWDQPRTNLAILCNYRPLRTTRAYQVLARTADRCGEPRQVGVAEFVLNEEFKVPAPGPGQVIYGDVEGLAPHGKERIRAALFRAPIFSVRFNDSSLGYRLLPTDGPDKIFAAAPGTDFPLPFAYAPQASSAVFEKEVTHLGEDGKVRVVFYSMPVKLLPKSPTTP